MGSSDGLLRRLWDCHRKCREAARDDRIGTIYQEAAERIEELEAEVLTNATYAELNRCRKRIEELEAENKVMTQSSESHT